MYFFQWVAPEWYPKMTAILGQLAAARVVFNYVSGQGVGP